MKKVKSGIIVLALILLAFNAFAAQISSLNFKNNIIVSEGGENSSSSNFKNDVAVGIINSVITSASYINKLGFFHLLLLADNQPCTTADQCEGGFCCSSLCSSSACPTEGGGGGPAPSTGGGAGGGGGGGGGGGAITPVQPIKSFSIDASLIKALVKQGGTYQTQFSITNTGTEALSFNLDYSELKDIMLLSDAQFRLAPGESKSIQVTIFAPEEKKPDVYSGIIRINAVNITKTLPVIIEVQAKKALFDIIVKVLPQSKNVLKGEKVLANITLINVGDLKPVDTEMYYSIRDIEGHDLTFGTETLAIYNQVSRIIELEMPPNATFGTYLMYGRVSYGKATAAAGDVFYLVNIKPPSCYDGIKNQNEEDVDCGGVCEPCKFSFAVFLKYIISFVIKYRILIIIIIVFLIIVLILILKVSRRRKEEERRIKLRKKLNEVAIFVNRQLSKGYSPEKIRDALLSAGWKKELADRIIRKIISDRARRK